MRSRKTFYSFSIRIRVLAVFISACLLFLCISFFRVQILRGNEYRDLAVNNRVRRIYVPARRGRIYDRKGKLLVDNRPSYNVQVLREEIRDKKKLVSELARILGMSEKKITRRINSTASFSYMPNTVRRDIDSELLVRMEEMTYSLPGVDISVTPVRDYLVGRTGAHIFGQVGKIPPKSLDRYLELGYQRDDIVGRAGLEYGYEQYLRGKEGGMQVQVDSRGIKDQVLGYIPPVPGSDAVLTIDNELQEKMVELYTDKIGSGVVLNYKTGEVLAMGSFPAYDPNVFVKPLTQKTVDEIFRNPVAPLNNRAIAGMYPPGSVFKPIVALAGLESKVIDTQTTTFCNGSYRLGKAKFRCWKKYGHGRMDVIDALKNSCNVFFYTMARDLGVDRIYRYGSMFNLGKKSGIDLPGEKRGVLPSREWKRMQLKEDWYGGESINYSIGQGYLLVTPLQICSYTTGLATRGRIMVPYLVDRCINSEGEIVFQNKPRVSTDVKFDKDALDTVIEGMRRVVQDKDGTGKRAYIKGLDMYGKTGTAQFSRRGEEVKCTWFICFILDERYPFATTFLVEEGISGGTTCAPMTGQMVEKIVELYGPPPEEDKAAPEAGEQKKAVQNAQSVQTDAPQVSEEEVEFTQNVTEGLNENAQEQ